jgi:hypothetical protein
MGLEKENNQFLEGPNVFGGEVGRSPSCLRGMLALSLYCKISH